MIEFQQVYKSYRVAGVPVPAVQPCDLVIPERKVFGLIGHSGAGKSTLLRLVNRLEEPTGGTIRVDGEAVTDLSPQGLRRFRQRVGMIFQHFNLLSSKTVAENVSMPLKLGGNHTRAEVQARVARLLERVGLSEHANKYPAQLSGGQKQRVGIARALSTGPSILLCDEATSALDPQTTAQVLNLLAELNRELGLTIVIITHEMEVIRKVCDHVAVMDAGAVVEQGPVSDVFLHPRHPTTQRLVQESEHSSDLSQEDELAAITGSVPGTVVRLTMVGEHTHLPLLGEVARRTGVDYRILQARVDRIKDTPYGQFTVALVGGDSAAAITQFQDAQVTVEVIRA